jgi:Zincin-like metallopeptidase
VGAWYRVIKTIKGHRYVYQQRTWREGKHVRTDSRYIGPAGSAADISTHATGGKGDDPGPQTAVNTTKLEQGQVEPERPPPVPQKLIEDTFRQLTKRVEVPSPPILFNDSRYGKSLVRKNREVERLLKTLHPTWTHGAAGAFYSLNRDKINIPPLRMFEDQPGETATQTYYAVVFHELAHWTGQWERTNRHASFNLYRVRDYAREELVAEATATILMRHFNLRSDGLEGHARYFQMYLDDAGDRKEAIAFAMAEARRAADFILGVNTT